MSLNCILILKLVCMCLRLMDLIPTDHHGPHLGASSRSRAAGLAPDLGPGPGVAAADRAPSSGTSTGRREAIGLRGHRWRTATPDTASSQSAEESCA